MASIYRCDHCNNSASGYCLCNAIFICNDCVSEHKDIESLHEIVSIDRFSSFRSQISQTKPEVKNNFKKRPNFK